MKAQKSGSLYFCLSCAVSERLKMTESHLPASRTDASVLPSLLELFILTSSSGAIFRIVSSASADGAVSFHGESYDAVAISLQGLQFSSDGRLPRPVLTISATDPLLWAEARGNRMRGGTVDRITTFVTELDPPLGQGGNAQFETEKWAIERMLQMDETQIKLQLAPAVCLDSCQLPSVMMLRDICQHHYRVWDADAAQFDYSRATCPYTGTDYFNEQGLADTDPAHDVCSLRLGSGCKKRFSDTLPFFGFPGLS